ncbi:family 4 glycosyl hydrolase [Aeromicrobium sp.]
MTRIVLIGSGSVEFTRNLLGDFLVYPELHSAEIVLHDIDPRRRQRSSLRR